ncbi:MAG: hypothetical protein IPP13_22450 [Kouleothrix sp.]|jgi:hypothetical protein|nr:hypothetical protein [Kouleothrix sp.]
MPKLRKVLASEAADWPCSPPPRTAQPSTATLQNLLKRLPDRRGITRIDRAGAAGGEHAWRGRVYTRGVELHRQFADALYGGPAGALRAAVAWRDGMRQLAGPAPEGSRSQSLGRPPFRFR